MLYLLQLTARGSILNYRVIQDIVSIASLFPIGDGLLLHLFLLKERLRRRPELPKQYVILSSSRPFRRLCRRSQMLILRLVDEGCAPLRL